MTTTQRMESAITSVDINYNLLTMREGIPTTPHEHARLYMLALLQYVVEAEEELEHKTEERRRYVEGQLHPQF